MVSSMVGQTIGREEGSKYMGLVFTRFVSILRFNLMGLVPYSFSVTSQLSVTITLAMRVWMGKLVVIGREHGRHGLNLLLPQGIPFGLVPVMVARERLGFVVTVISLSVRLFANMMAGHVLLKVFGGFAWSMMVGGGRLYWMHFRPLGMLFRLMGLETGVAFVQAYVFALLVSIYLSDAVHGGH